MYLHIWIGIDIYDINIIVFASYTYVYDRPYRAAPESPEGTSVTRCSNCHPRNL